MSDEMDEVPPWNPATESLFGSPVSLMSGDGWQRCCICFELHQRPFMNLYVDRDGHRWDLCRGDCAREAGMTDAE